MRFRISVYTGLQCFRVDGGGLGRRCWFCLLEAARGDNFNIRAIRLRASCLRDRQGSS